MLCEVDLRWEEVSLADCWCARAKTNKARSDVYHSCYGCVYSESFRSALRAQFRLLTQVKGWHNGVDSERPIRACEAQRLARHPLRAPTRLSMHAS